jgi:ATP-binding cassette subfamily B protein
MKNKLTGSLTRLTLIQFFEFFPYYVVALLCLYGTHWIQAKLPFYAKELADAVEATMSDVSLAKFFYLAIGIIICRTGSRFLFFYPARVLQKTLRVELLARLEEASPNRYKKFTSGELFQVLSNAMEGIRGFIGFALLQVGNIIMAMIVLIPKLFEFNSELLMALLPMVAGFIIFTIIAATNKVFFRRAQDLESEVQNFIIETYAGKQTVKNYHSEFSFIELFKGHSYKELLNDYRASKRFAFGFPLVPLGLGLSFIWGAIIIKQQDLGASSLVLFSGFLYLFLEPLSFLAWIGVVFARAHGAWAKIMEVTDLLDIESETEKKIKNLNSDNDSDDFIIPFWSSEININLRPNILSVLVGKTGCGKSEVLRQVADVLRLKNKKVSYVAQAPYLYNDSLINNIFLGLEITDEKKDQAYELLKLFGLDYLEKDRHSLLEMEVGENGKRLSGGQSKRLCLVRSLMSEANYLVWDDPFSSVDLILEKQIFAALKEKNILKDKYLILSSHRLSTVKLCDDVHYLKEEEGVRESGVVEEVFSTKGEIYAYFQNQMV